MNFGRSEISSADGTDMCNVFMARFLRWFLISHAYKSWKAKIDRVWLRKMYSCTVFYLEYFPKTAAMVMHLFFIERISVQCSFKHEFVRPND